MPKLVNIDKIQALCKERKISQALVCRKLGLGRAYFNDVRRGVSYISDERLEIIAETLDINIEYLRDKTEEIKPYKTEKAPQPVELSEDEKAVLEAFNSLSEEQKDSLLKLMRSLKEKQKEE